MKATFPAIFALGFLCLAGFVKKESENYEQITFDYFVSDILKSDFKDVTSFEFKGRTEESFSSLGSYKFCLRPEEKLGTAIQELTKRTTKSHVKEIEFKNTDALKISDFQKKATGYRLFVYPSLHVADNYYVFLSFQKRKEESVKYIIELTPDGEISRSCRID
jgi:hypothetical protein